jgi:hypothetical protein
MIRAYSIILLLACACEPRLDNSKCQIYITNPLVTMYEEPRNFSQEMVKVPTGKYDVLDTQKTEWVDKNERWLKIQVGKREGWIKDNTWRFADLQTRLHSKRLSEKSITEKDT